MSFKVVRGATLLIPSSPTIKHLHVVMCDPVEPFKDVLLVPVSTYRARPGDDQTCLLQPGDHPFIKHLSYVKYELAEQYLESKIERMVAKNLYREQGMIADHVFHKILEGFNVSIFVKPFTREYIRPGPFSRKLQ